jgi:multiple sugar transport system permease protein
MRRQRFPRLSEKMGGVLDFDDYKKPIHRFGYAMIIVILAFFSVVALLPIVWLFVSAMKTVSELNSVNYHFFPAEWNWGKIGDLWEKLDFTRYYFNTFVYVAGAMVCAVVFNALMAYATSVIKPAGYKIVDKLIFLGYMIPSILNIFPLLMEIKSLGFLNPDNESYLTYLPLWLSFGANAYYYMLFKDYFDRLPKSLLEAARMDGATQIEIFWRVVLPLSRPIIGIVTIFSMTASYSDFLLPYLVLNGDKYQTIMVGIYNISGTTVLDPSEFLLMLVLSIIPQIVIFLIFQKQIMGTNASGGMKE